MSKVAVTALASFITTLQMPSVTESHPAQPMKVESISGEAVRSTVEPDTYASLQEPEQTVPDGNVILPLPVPAVVTEIPNAWTMPVPLRGTAMSG